MTDLLQLATEQFSTILELRLQQRDSKLRGKTREEVHVGQQASPIQYVSHVNALQPSAPGGPLVYQDSAMMRRWCSPLAFEQARIIDTYEQLQTLIDPQSQYVADQASATYRAWDQVLINAQFGTAQIGTGVAAALTNETWAQAQTTATGTSTGLTVQPNFDGSTASGNNVGMTIEKIIEGQRIMAHLHVPYDMEDRYIVLGSQQYSDLMKEVQLTDSTFSGRYPLQTGEIPQVLGWNIICSELLPTATVNAGTCRQCFMFVRSGLHFGIWKEMFVDIDRNKTLAGYPIQIFTQTMIGATRLEPGRTIEIDCLDSTGADIEA